MDDVAVQPQSESARSRDEVRVRFENAAALAARGVAPDQVAEALLEGAEPAEVLDSEQWSTLPAEVRLEASLLVAWLAAEQGDDALTLSAATRALEVQPENERALALAEPLWLESGAFVDFAERYALAATAAGSEARARQLLERALHMLQGCHAALPAAVGIGERLAQLPRLRDAEESLIATLNGGSVEANAALAKLGERWLKEGRAREGASAIPRDLSAFEGDAALDMLERLFDQADDVPRLAQVLRKRVESAPTPQARGRALDALARLEQERRSDLAAAAGAWLASAQAFLEAGEPDDAERVYEQLLEVLPDHLNAAARLVELRARAGNFTGVTQAFEVLLRAEAAAPHAAELLLRIAADAERACAADELSELMESVLWRLTADDRSLSEKLLRATAAAFVAQDRDDEAAELYRRLITDFAAEEDLRAFQALIDSNPGSDWRQGQQRWLFEWREYHDEERATVLFEWASFEETEAGDPASAAAVLARAAELAPGRAEVWQKLAHLRFAGGDGAGGVAAAEQLRRLGHELAPDLLSNVLEHDAGARWAVDLLKLSLSAERRFAELFDLYDRAIAVSPSATDRARWLDEAAIAARDVAEDRERATRYWEAFIELLPEDVRVDVALERLYEQSRNHSAQLAHLKRRLARAPLELRPAVEARIVGLALDLGAVDEALAAGVRLADLKPASALPLLESTFARCAELWANPEARSCGKRCAELLRATYAEERAPAEVARVLRAELTLELELEERCARLRALSRLCEDELADMPGAFQAARAAFLATLADADQRRLEELTQRLGCWSELVETYLDASDSELGLVARRNVLRRASEVASERLEGESLETASYEALFSLDPTTAQSELASLGPKDTVAFEAMCRVLARACRFEELVRALEDRAASLAAPALYSRLARLQAEELNDPRSAIASHLLANDAPAAAAVFLRQPSVFRDEPDRALALAALLDSIGLPEGRLRVLRHQLAAFGDEFPAARKSVQLALALDLEAAGDSHAAHELLRESAKRYPTDAGVQRAAAAAAAARKDWERAEQCYRTLLLLLHGDGAATPDLRRATVYVELAAIKREREDPIAAAQLVESGFEAAIDNVEELLALTRGLLSRGILEPAERAATQLLAHGEPCAVAEALRALASLRERGHRLSASTAASAALAASSAIARRRELRDAEQRSGLLTASIAFLPLDEAEHLLSLAEGDFEGEDAVSASVELARRFLERGDEAGRMAATARLRSLVTHPEAPGVAWQLLAKACELSGDAEALAGAIDGWLTRCPHDSAVLTRALEVAVQRAELPRSLELRQRLERAGAELSPELSMQLSALCRSGGKVEIAAPMLER